MNSVEIKFQQLLDHEKKTIESINNATTPIIYPIDMFNGFIIDKVPQHILDSLDKHIKSMDLGNPSELPGNHYSLAGNIENQYSVPIETDLEDYVYWLCEMYMKRFPNFKNSTYYANGIQKEVETKLKLYSLWVNFMKKHEFNPPHTHSGRFSFVIWHKIPYDLETEMRVSPSQRLDKNNLAGVFQFSYPTFSEAGIGLTNIRADNRYEGKICVFPAYLHHAVFPFYSSNEYRISVAGNINFVNGE